MRSVGCCFVMFQMKARYSILDRKFQMKNLYFQMHRTSSQSRYCAVFSIYSTRLLIFIKVNFSFNFMREVPSNATFNFKTKGPVSSANLSELEWMPSKFLRVKTGKEKALDTLLASRACRMCCQAASCAEHTVSDRGVQGEGRGRENGCLSSSSGGYNQYYYSDLSESLEHSWRGNAGCYPYYWTQAKPYLL